MHCVPSPSAGQRTPAILISSSLLAAQYLLFKSRQSQMLSGPWRMPLARTTKVAGPLAAWRQSLLYGCLSAAPLHPQTPCHKDSCLHLIYDRVQWLPCSAAHPKICMQNENCVCLHMYLSHVNVEGDRLAWPGVPGGTPTYQCSGRAVSVRLPCKSGRRRGAGTDSGEALEVQLILRTYSTPAQVCRPYQLNDSSSGIAMSLQPQVKKATTLPHVPILQVQYMPAVTLAPVL